jgi:Histidine kinase-, DNA gyrase B-, and HSP90-like ATPase
MMTNSNAMEPYSLWKRTLGSKTEENTNSVEILRQSYLSFRERVSHLVSDIGALLPGLTVHDITHLDQLWRIADEIAGPEYPLNPAEAYVLGGAFLLHDSAHVLAAYPKRLDGIRNSTEWKDLIAQRFDQTEPVKGSDDEKKALFFVLRDLHAKQASKLPFLSWRVPKTNQEMFLIENASIRNTYGNLIGQIAESHHWDIDRVRETFSGSVLGTPPLLGGVDWPVDALKIALLLRTSDAAHISADRAPWFLFALRQPQGISEAHWKFQAEMLQPKRQPSGALRFTAGNPFDRDNKVAWWLAYDTACMIDRELKAAGKCLLNFSRPQFLSSSVDGVDDPERFAKFVPVVGWEPVNVTPKIGNIPGMIAALGGSKLYGDAPQFPIRELIQNAADAIRALRALGGLAADSGTITVGLEKIDNGYRLFIQDDGIGMSKYALTEYLLDFGKSLWVSDELRRELPGLSATDFKSVGKFGIGFFSVFMLGSRVSVTTMRYRTKENEKSDQWLLEFENGLSDRPILRKPEDSERLNHRGTRVSVELRKEMLEPILIDEDLTAEYGIDDVAEGLAGLIGQVCPTIDIKIELNCIHYLSPHVIVFPNDWKTITSEELGVRLDFWQISHRVPVLTDLKNEKTGEVIGRVSLENDQVTGVSLTHQGLFIDKSYCLTGVLLASNPSDLIRSSSMPIASAIDWSEWAKRWLAAPHTVPPSQKEVIQIHQLCTDIDLPVYRFFGKSRHKWELSLEVKKLNEIFVHYGMLEYQSRKDKETEKAFAHRFIYSSILLEIPKIDQLLAEFLQIEEVDYLGIIEQAVNEAWGGFISEAVQNHVVGSVNGTKILRDVIKFSRL